MWQADFNPETSKSLMLIVPNNLKQPYLKEGDRISIDIEAEIFDNDIILFSDERGESGFGIIHFLSDMEYSIKRLELGAKFCNYNKDSITALAKVSILSV